MPVEIRPVEDRDIAAMAGLRAQTWGTESYWETRIDSYLRGELWPRHALAPRTAFIAIENGKAVGLVAGHLTRRHGCDGELEFIDVDREHRGLGIAGILVATMAHWFVGQQAWQVCVDVDPMNVAARKLYAKHGAVRLNERWMVWEDARVMGLHSEIL